MLTSRYVRSKARQHQVSALGFEPMSILYAEGHSMPAVLEVFLKVSLKA